VLESAKSWIEAVTGIATPGPRDLAALLRARRPLRFRFAATAGIPNNRWPMIVYRDAVARDARYDPAAIFEALFAKNGWKGQWRDGMYDWLHYHSNTHEVLGVARGWLHGRFGGAKGRLIKVTAGDVLVLPAGTGHHRVRKSPDLLIVGAYPGGRKYDECEPKDTNAKIEASVARVPRPARDPVYGKDGPLRSVWAR
jgi:uncharacterized protein YjlB